MPDEKTVRCHSFTGRVSTVPRRAPNITDTFTYKTLCRYYVSVILWLYLSVIKGKRRKPVLSLFILNNNESVVYFFCKYPLFKLLGLHTHLWVQVQVTCVRRVELAMMIPFYYRLSPPCATCASYHRLFGTLFHRIHFITLFSAFKHIHNMR